MNKVEQKLSSWHKVYKELQDARRRLQSASALRGHEQAFLEAEVRRLQSDSDSALAEVQSLMANRHAAVQLNGHCLEQEGRNVP